jgi:hypothetical protein
MSKSVYQNERYLHHFRCVIDNRLFLVGLLFNMGQQEENYRPGLLKACRPGMQRAWQEWAPAASSHYRCRLHIDRRHYVEKDQNCIFYGVKLL